MTAAMKTMEVMTATAVRLTQMTTPVARIVTMKAAVVAATSPTFG
jgi:hypothetical protein